MLVEEPVERRAAYPELPCGFQFVAAIEIEDAQKVVVDDGIKVQELGCRDWKRCWNA